MAATETVPILDQDRPMFVGHPWSGVLRALERAPDLGAIRAHRLHLLEAQRRREDGLPLPDDLADDVLAAVRATLLVKALLVRVRDICDGPILLFKGPEVAAAYPAPWLRPYIDVDILVADASETELRLRRAGFEGVGPILDWDTLHHVQRLLAPDIPAAVEVHRRPKWIWGGAPPSFEELLETSVLSATGIDGIFAPAPRFHAVLVAAHAWAERPLGRLGDLVDVAALHGVDPQGAEEVARAFGLERAWRTTMRATDAVLGEGPRSWATATWARHLGPIRDRTVLEAHLARVLEPFASNPPRVAMRGLVGALRATLLPHGGEGWRAKLRRSRKALRSARGSVSEHERSLAGNEDEGR